VVPWALFPQDSNKFEKVREITAGLDVIVHVCLDFKSLDWMASNKIGKNPTLMKLSEMGS
jgi:hypothetical protein